MQTDNESHWLPWLPSSGGWKWLTLVMAMRTISDRFVGFLLPIYIWRLIHTTWEVQLAGRDAVVLTAVCLAGYYSLARLIGVIYVYLVSATKWTRWSEAMVGFGHAFLVVKLVALAGASATPILLVVAAIAHALEVSNYNFVIGSWLDKHIDRHHAGQELGTVQILIQLVSVLAPAIGAWLATVAGFNILYILGTGMAIAMSGVIIATELVREPITFFRQRRIEPWLSWKVPDHRSLMVGWIARYGNDLATLFWPLWLFVLLGTIERVGFLITLSLFLGFIVTFIIGKTVDGAHDGKPFILSSITISVLWLVRLVIRSWSGLTLVLSLDKLVGDAHWVTYDATMYKKVDSIAPARWLATREIMYSLAGLVLWPIIALLFWQASTLGWHFIFMLGALGALGTTAIHWSGRWPGEHVK